MGILDDLISNVPWEKFILQPPDKTKALEELARILRKSAASVPSNEPQETPEPLSTSAEQATGVSDQQTLLYQLGLILADLDHLETEHLPEKGRIADLPCDCIAKAGRSLRRHAIETIPIAARQGKHNVVYSEAAAWAERMMEIGTQEAVASGQYDEQYLREAGTASKFRKVVERLQSEARSAMPQMAEAKPEVKCSECATLDELRSRLEKRRAERSDA